MLQDTVSIQHDYKKLNRTMKSEEIARILGMGMSLVDEYIRILNEEGDQ